MLRIMTENKPIFFVRHLFSSTDETLVDLWNRRKIAIHYDDVPSLEPKDYSKKNQKAATEMLNNFKECRDKGAIVVAIFRKINRNTVLLGEIEKGTKIEFPEYPYKNKKSILKTMQMKNVREYHFIKFPILSAALPRQGTMKHIRQAERIIRHLFENKQLPDTVYSLSPEQLEVLCYEYLKRRGKIESLLLPIGRNLIDVDIIGLNKDGNKISAQVTFAKEKAKVLDKFERLIDSIPKGDTNTELLFFAPENEYIDSIKYKYKNIDDENFVNIEDVYDYLKSDESGKLLIDTMLGRF